MNRYTMTATFAPITPLTDDERDDLMAAVVDAVRGDVTSSAVTGPPTLLVTVAVGILCDSDTIVIEDADAIRASDPGVFGVPVEAVRAYRHGQRLGNHGLITG